MSLLLLFKISGEKREKKTREKEKERHFCNHETIVGSDQREKRKNIYIKRGKKKHRKRERDVSSTGFLEEAKLFAEREHEIYIDVYVS